MQRHVMSVMSFRSMPFRRTTLALLACATFAVLTLQWMHVVNLQLGMGRGKRGQRLRAPARLRLSALAAAR